MNREPGSRMLNITDKNKLPRRRSRRPSISSNAMRIEVLKCLEGESAFSQEMLTRLIAQAEAEVNQAKDEYATLLKNNDHRATVQ